MDLKFFIDKLNSGSDLTAAESVSCFSSVRSATNETQIEDLLMAWSRKGATVDEVAAIARELRATCKRIRSNHKKFVDIVGTGGSRSKTFNVSTAAAFVIAGAGLPVAKHGNRAASSSSGSADVLAELGVDLAVAAQKAEECLGDIGMCFMFAPHFHSLPPILGKVRKRLGIPTIFNVLGPLCNPAGTQFHLIGSSDERLQGIIADALKELGTTRSWVVNSRGLDELSISQTTTVREVSGDGVIEFKITPEEFGVTSRPSAKFKPMTPAESAQTILKLFSGDLGGACRDLVVLNAAAALFIAGYGTTKRESFEFADESLRSGKALQKLNDLRRRAAA